MAKKASVNELWHDSQVRTTLGKLVKIVLKELLKKRKIVSFKKPKLGKLSYRIIYSGNKDYEISFVASKSNLTFLGLDGAEVGEYSGSKLLILYNKNLLPKIKRIRKIIIEDLGQRNSGLLLEKSFSEDAKFLITSFKEVSNIIKDIESTSDYDDSINKIDFFFILPNNKKVPIQIKSSISGQIKHKKIRPNVPSIIYKEKDNLLKNKILQIVKSYQKGLVEHL